MNDKINFKEALNAEQLNVVENADGPALVLAGAGSGKTRTIIYRVARLLEDGVDPSSILLLTFTNKAAKEMIERLKGLLGGGVDGIWSGTFHSISNRLLRKYASLLGYSSNYTILDQDDSKALLKMCVKELKITGGAKRFPSAAVLQSILSYSRNASLSVRDTLGKRFVQFVDFEADISNIGDLYRRKKLEANSMDFDDLLLKMLELFVENPDVEDRLAESFKYVLVDEYQDTNSLQANLIARLSKIHRNVLVVGDDAQSIYSFRAADISNILNFPNIFNGAKTFRLETNYRSTPEILQLANESISCNLKQFEKSLKPFNGHGDRPELAVNASPREEARYIVLRINAYLDSGVNPEEIAVLFRAAYQSQALEFELMRDGIAYEYRGGLRFFERAHVKDVLAFIRLIENRKDEASWMRVLGMVQGVGPATAVKIISVVKNLEGDELFIDDILDSLPKRAGKGWIAARGMIEKVFKKDGLSAQIRAVLATTYIEYLEAQYTNSSDRLQDLEQLALFSEQYEGRRSEFLEDVTLSDELSAIMNTSVYNTSQVVLSTIHQSKGLEWDAVFVISLTNGGFPGRRAMEEDGDLEEERRLFYVAATRARKYLHLTYSMTGLGDNYQGLSPSMFLEELPRGLVDTIGSRERRSNSFDSRSYNAKRKSDTTVFDSSDQGSFYEEESNEHKGFLGTY